MEEINYCTLCGSNKRKLLFEGVDLMYGGSQEYPLCQCQECGLIYLSLRPEESELASFYPENYLAFPKAIEDEKSWLRRLDRNYGMYRHYREIMRHTDGAGRLLDVGCATGTFLNYMRERGWDVVGIEPNVRAAQYSRQRYRLDVRQCQLEDNDFSDSSFDVITLWDVFEHVPNPKLIITEASRLLKAGGLLVISIPNPDSIERIWFGSSWAGWDVPRHFHIFSRSTLSRLLSTTDMVFEAASSFTSRHGGFVISVEFLMTKWAIPARLKRIISLLIRSIPARVLSYPYFSIASRVNQSSYITVFIRKCEGSSHGR